MKDTDIQWHPEFIGAMNLELKKNRDDLLFEKEHNLNTACINPMVKHWIRSKRMM